MFFCYSAKFREYIRVKCSVNKVHFCGNPWDDNLLNMCAMLCRQLWSSVSRRPNAKDLQLYRTSRGITLVPCSPYTVNCKSPSLYVLLPSAVNNNNNNNNNKVIHTAQICRSRKWLPCWQIWFAHFQVHFRLLYSVMRLVNWYHRFDTKLPKRINIFWLLASYRCSRDFLLRTH